MVLPLITLPVIMDKSLISDIYLMPSFVLFDSTSTQTHLHASSLIGDEESHLNKEK